MDERRASMSMAFINEFVSEADVKIYGLDGIWDACHPLRKGERPFGFRYAWSIDRDRRIFLMWVGAGREEFSNRLEFALWWNGNLLTATLDDVGKEKNSKTWDLINIRIPTDFKNGNADVVSVLKEALIVYGYRGAQAQLPNNYSVEFNF